MLVGYASDEEDAEEEQQNILEVVTDVNYLGRAAQSQVGKLIPNTNLMVTDPVTSVGVLKRTAQGEALGVPTKTPRLELPSFQDRKSDKRADVIFSPARFAENPERVESNNNMGASTIVPPQLRQKGRKNVSTEDHSQWNTKATTAAIVAKQVG